MKIAFKLEMISLMTLLLFIFLVRDVQASPLTLVLSSSSEDYNIGEEITLNGTLTLNGLPFSDGLVTVQIDKPDATLWVICTRPTGTNITQQWSLEIVEATLWSGTTVSRGDLVGFNVTVRNNDLIAHNFILIVNTFYSNSVPFAISEMVNYTISANKTRRISISSVLAIPLNAPIGNATAYFNILTDLPTNGGFAYGPEKPLVFEIVGGGGGGSVPPVQEPEPAEGAYTLKLRTPDLGTKLGNYTVHARSVYMPFTTQATCTIEIILRGDITGPDGNPDGKCDIRDIARAAQAYGSYPGDPNWDPVADVNDDGKVDIKDVAIVARDYGKEGEL